MSTARSAGTQVSPDRLAEAFEALAQRLDTTPIKLTASDPVLRAIEAVERTAGRIR